MVIVAQWQSTGGHNQLYSQQWLLLPFSLLMMFENDYLWFDYHFDFSCYHLMILLNVIVYTASGAGDKGD